jgi:hypothetical protein
MVESLHKNTFRQQFSSILEQLHISQTCMNRKLQFWFSENAAGSIQTTVAGTKTHTSTTEIACKPIFEYYPIVRKLQLVGEHKLSNM